MKSYVELEQRFHEIQVLDSLSWVLFWDTKTAMPRSASGTRAEQAALVKALRHERLTAPQLGDLLSDTESRRAGLTDWQRANLREMRRHWIHANASDRALTVRTARVFNDAGTAWLAAKSDNDFASFAPHLAKVIAVLRETADRKAAFMGLGPYDAMLDEHDPGTRASHLEPLFSDLERSIPPLIAAVVERQRARPLRALGRLEREDQRRVLKLLLSRLGWPSDGQIAESEHAMALPGLPRDPRIALRFADPNPLYFLLAGVHEFGHATYELNLPQDSFQFQPVGVHRGASTHESQSLSAEMFAMRSSAFLSWLFPFLRQNLPVDPQLWSDSNLMAHYRRVLPGSNRVTADEVTYPLHVIIRYRLETAMLAGDLDAQSLPGAWADEYQRLLGIRPDSDTEGCLQDMHWSMGLIGYFPSYLLGAIKAAQFFATARRERSDLTTALGNGDFAPWLQWLRDKVQCHGSFHEGAELVEVATGRPLGTEDFKEHLNDRYLSG